VSLYLCVFRDDERDDEIDGVEVGSYDDFHTLRTAVAERLEGGTWGSRFPTLMGHPDSDGLWPPADADRLASELETIRDAFAALPATRVAGDWQAELAQKLRLSPRTFAECFIDVDGEPLLERLIALARTSAAHERPIWFQ